MECTQRLEFTQELYDTRSERVCPEQIGFLGICGVKHPVKRGPNKIGRDPQTCNIVINLNSVSRQHAVINILNSREFMLMDLDSANKTKLMDITLSPYIPHPLKNGDMVQFGDIFGVFRLLEEDNDLPMTQAMNIPETPVSSRYVSKLNKVPVTTIPESPDVSDRDDSFIASSQAKREKCSINSNNHFIKPSSNVIAIQPVGTNKIDNVYWSSAKQSVSLNSQLDDSNNLSNDLDISDKKINASIHDLETQQFDTIDKYVTNQGKDENIYNMETQNPFANLQSIVEHKNDDIHDSETQPLFLAEKSTKASNCENIHNFETQAPFVQDDSRKQDKPNIHEMDTQALAASKANDSTDSIYTANTQIPPLPSIHSLATQLIVPTNEKLPEVCKIVTQQEMQFSLFTANNNDDDIFGADTQPFYAKIKNTPQNTETKKDDAKKESAELKGQKLDDSKVNNISDEEILFEDIDNENLDVLDSQPLTVPSENLQETFTMTKSISINKRLDKKNNEINSGNVKPTLEVHSDSSTDCEDIALLPTQKITNIQDDDDLTDCEDLIDEVPENRDKNKNLVFEDMLTQKIDEDFNEEAIKENVNNDDFANLPTQVIINDDNIADMPTQVITVEKDKIEPHKSKLEKGICFEDLPTQVIEEDNLNKASIRQEVPLSNIKSDIYSPFKIPLISPIKIKRKDIKPILPKGKVIQHKIKSINVPDDDDDNYYTATQDILEDLCSQKDVKSKSGDSKHSQSDDELVPCSVEDYEIENRFQHLENSLSPESIKTSESSDGDKKICKLQHMTSQQIKDVIGVVPLSDNQRKESSDLSDVEKTPKKVRPIKFMDIDLPNSQEIKTSVSFHPKTSTTDTSSESEQDSEEQCTPILFRKKRKSKTDVKVDLIKKFDVETLPSRVITRVRKPTSKFQNTDDDTKKLAANILKPNFLTEQEDEIDKDIITENISRLKSKIEKSKNKGNSKKTNNKVKDEKTLGKENEQKPEKAENKVDKEKPKNSKTVKDSGDVAVKSELIKTTTTDIAISVEKEAGKIKTSKNTNQESKRKSNDDVTKVSKKLSEKEVQDSSNKDASIENKSSERRTRNTRNRRKEDTKEEIIVIEENPHKELKLKTNLRKQPIKNSVEIDLTEDAVSEVRRSKRQRTSKEKKEDQSSEKAEKLPKSILKKDKIEHEQSTVYSVSSESDSPNLKRSATSDLEPPSSKRTRSNNTANNISLRATPARMNRTQHVLFTAFPCEEVRAKLEKLGAVMVTDVSACTVVVTLAVRRTFKLLCAVGLGRPIVGAPWVQACADANMIVDPWLYVLHDAVAEKRFAFTLERVLQGKRNFLKGYHVSATPNVMPTAAEMKLIVECSGGVWKEGGPQWVCISCAADKALWPLMKKKGATVVSTEFILGGVLRQRVDIAANKL